MFDMYKFLYKITEPIYDVNKTIIVTILLVLIMRFLLRKSPKKYSYFLWMIVIIRMIFPISIKSIFSVYNLEKVITPVISNATINQIINIAQPQYYSNAINANEIIGATFIDIPGYNIMFDYISLTTLWLFGVVGILAYSISTYIDLKLNLKSSIKLRDNIYQSDNFTSPFVIGYIKPKIIIPFNLEKQAQRIIIEHEQLHIKRKDYLIRVLFYTLALFYWINPFVWLAYHLFIKDMEMSCDEYVLSNYEENNKIYSYTLLHVASNQQIGLPKPLAFGEKSIKQRVKNILSWKQPDKKTMFIGISLCLYCLLAFTTDPTNQKKFTELLEDYGITEIKQVNVENRFLETNQPKYYVEINSWLHLENLELVFDYIEVSEQSIKTSNNEIDLIYTITDMYNNQVIVKFTENYDECIVESNGNSKSYRIKNTVFTYENLKHSGIYSMKAYELIENRSGIKTEYDKLFLFEKDYHEDEDGIFDYSYAFVQVKQANTTGEYYSIKCNFEVEENQIIFTSMKDENLFVFDISKDNNDIQLKFNESKSYVVYEDMLERLKTIVFVEEEW